MEPFVIALVAHGVISGADVIFNHELVARIPARPNAGPEQRLHSARELVFAALFFALAWWQWHGLTALVIVALLLAELVVSTVDTVLEFDTRVLLVTERVAHVLLFVNFGIVVTLLGQALLGQALLAWGNLPTQLVATDYDAMSWVLSALGALALGWSIRDALSAMRWREIAQTKLKPTSSSRTRGPIGR